MYEFIPLGEGSFFKSKSGKMAGSFIAQRRYLIDGARHRKTFSASTKKRAKAKMEAYEESMFLTLAKSGKPRRVELQEMTLAEWIYCWLIRFKEGQVKPSTYDSYMDYLKYYILPVFDTTTLGNLDVMQLQLYYNDQAKKLSPSTIKKINAIINQALKSAVDFDIITSNPADKCKLPKRKKTRPRVLSHQEQEKFLAALSPADPFAPIYLTMLGAGLRIGEALALSVQDVDLTHDAIHVSHTLPRKGSYTVYNLPTTKNWEDRYLPLSPSLKKVLQGQIIKLKEMHLLAGKPWPENTFLFQTSNLTPLMQTNVLKHLKIILQRADLPEDITNHTLRHTFATRLVEQGLDISIVKELLGHEDISTTADYYIDISKDLIDQQKNILNNILSASARESAREI
ncbi:tyrosine-type recombinase/integrase [Peptococcus simiae]|uniref:tyrosine-type recombinase/integrase n=2 Tax=Peptococcus simiae TaxID=1643805 RepID=UPI00397F83FD